MPKHLEDHWAARPKQQRALLTRLFRWKADGGGREILLLAGAGRAEGCAAAETKLEFKMPSGEGGQGTGIAKPGGRGGGVEREDATEENAQTKANARSVGISQVKGLLLQGKLASVYKATRDSLLLCAPSGAPLAWHDGSICRLSRVKRFPNLDMTNLLVRRIPAKIN